MTMDALSPIAAGVPEAPLGPYKDLRSKRAYEDLEAVFVKFLLKEMREASPDDGIFKKTHAAKIFDDMLDDALSRSIAQSGQLGLAAGMAERERVLELQRDLLAQEAIMRREALEPLKLGHALADNITTAS